jgi:hypothetical protein
MAKIRQAIDLTTFSVLSHYTKVLTIIQTVEYLIRKNRFYSIFTVPSILNIE